MITSNDFDFDLDSENIQAAINSAACSKDHTVLIPRLNSRTGLPLWSISKTILLPSDITVILENCHLRMADGVMCNMFRNKNMYTRPISSEYRQSNINIIGKGAPVLDGGLPNGLLELNSEKHGLPHIRTNNLILFHNVDGFRVENLMVRDQRWWAINFIRCSNGHISDINSLAYNNIPNQDGVNLRVGCHNITIERITGQSGDDLVAITALCESDLPLSPDDADISDVTVRDIVGTSVRQCVVTLRNQDIARLYNVSVENVLETNNGDENNRPYGVIQVGENSYFKKHPSPIGSAHHITVSNVYGRIGNVFTIGATLEDSKFQNIRSDGGNTAFTVRKVNYGGIKMRRVTVDSILGNTKDELIQLDQMRPDDYIESLTISRSGPGKASFAGNIAVTLEDCSLETKIDERVTLKC